MSTTLNHVNPGDIISAANWNILIDAINTAQLRLDALEAGASGGNDLAITQLIPDGPYRVGDLLQIIGQNFQFSAGATRVFLNATQVLNLLPTSTDARLDFLIPSVPGLVETGSTVDLVVLNQTQSATRRIVLRPRLNPLQGNITVEWQGVSPATVVSGQPASFVYRVTSGANNRAIWALSAVVTVASNADAWNSQLRIIDPQGNVLNPRQITLDPGQQVDLQVQIPSVPVVANGTSFGLSLTASSGGISGNSGVRQFVVGTATPPPDTSLSLATVPALSQGALVGDTLTVPGGQSRPLAIRVDLTVAGVYNVTRSVLAGASGWAVNLDSGTLDSFTINPSDLAGTGSTQRLLRYAVAATATASTPAQIQVQVQRQGNASSRSITLNTVRS